MCYAIPGRLVELSGERGVVDYYGEKRAVRVESGRAEVGDYIYAQGGILVRKIPQKEALEVLGAWQELFVELKAIDRQRSQINDSAQASNVLGLLQKINKNNPLTCGDALKLLALTDKKDLDLFFNLANNIRQKNHGNAACVHGILEFSNYCARNCLYCGIRNASGVSRYRMAPDEIYRACEYAVKELKFYALSLQSGEDYEYTDDMLVDIVEKLRKLEILIILSIGERSPEVYRRLYEAGARGALVRFETSNSKIFETMKPGSSLENRLRLISELKRMNYIVATGFMLGLPGESDEDIYNNIMLTKSLKPEMYSFGPFISSQHTSLEHHPQPQFTKVLKTIALARVLDPNSNILVTTAMETLRMKSGTLALALEAGANSMMANITPHKYRKLYSIYNNRYGADLDTQATIKKAVTSLKTIGRAPVDVG